METTYLFPRLWATTFAKVNPRVGSPMTTPSTALAAPPDAPGELAGAEVAEGGVDAAEPGAEAGTDDLADVVGDGRAARRPVPEASQVTAVVIAAIATHGRRSARSPQSPGPARPAATRRCRSVRYRCGGPIRRSGCVGYCGSGRSLRRRNRRKRFRVRLRRRSEHRRHRPSATRHRLSLAHCRCRKSIRTTRDRQRSVLSIRTAAHAPARQQAPKGGNPPIHNARPAQHESSLSVASNTSARHMRSSPKPQAVASNIESGVFTPAAGMKLHLRTYPA